MQKTKKYLNVPKNIQKYQKLSKNTIKKNLEVPKSIQKYSKISKSIQKYQ